LTGGKWITRLGNGSDKRLVVGEEGEGRPSREKNGNAGQQQGWRPKVHGQRWNSWILWGKRPKVANIPGNVVAERIYMGARIVIGEGKDNCRGGTTERISRG
jgi:hypothetical protein